MSCKRLTLAAHRRIKEVTGHVRGAAAGCTHPARPLASIGRRQGASVALAAVFAATMAMPSLASAAQIWAWGNNEKGALGVGAIELSEGCMVSGHPECSATPLAVSGIEGEPVAVSGGNQSSMALVKDLSTGVNEVWTWGANENGQLGDGTEQPSSDVPVRVCAVGVNTCPPGSPPTSYLSNVKAISAGFRTDMALLENGTVVTWGDNREGTLGNGSSIASSPVPVDVPGLSNVTAIAGGNQISLALLGGGEVMAWGWNKEGRIARNPEAGPEFCQAGSAKNPCSRKPLEVKLPEGAMAIAASQAGGAALLVGGTVMTWGSNFQNSLGNGTKVAELPSSYKPVAVCAEREAAPCEHTLSGVAAISEQAGGSTPVALLEASGEVRAWGLNVHGQVGDGEDGYQFNPPAPRAVCPVGLEKSCTNGPHLSGVTSIGSAGETNFALVPGGKVLAWGYGGAGELGDGYFGIQHYVNVPIEVLNEVTAITGGSHHILAIRPSGPQFKQNGEVLGKTKAQTFDAGEVTLEYGSNLKARCHLLASGNVWNEGLRGRANTEAFVVEGCHQTEPSQCSEISLVAENPLKKEAAVERSASLPWLGEMSREGAADRLRISGIRVTLVDPCAGLETAFEGALHPKVANGVENGLHPSHLQFGKEAGFLVSALGEGEANGLLLTSTPLKEESPLKEVKLAGEEMQLISTTE